MSPCRKGEHVTLSFVTVTVGLVGFTTVNDTYKTSYTNVQKRYNTAMAPLLGAINVRVHV